MVEKIEPLEAAAAVEAAETSLEISGPGQRTKRAQTAAGRDSSPAELGAPKIVAFAVYLLKAEPPRSPLRWGKLSELLSEATQNLGIALASASLGIERNESAQNQGAVCKAVEAAAETNTR